MNSKIEITVCMGSACFARGNEQNLNFIEKFIKDNNLNAQIELIGSRCEGDCPDGPNVIINNVKYHKVNEKKLEEVLKELKDG